MRRSLGPLLLAPLLAVTLAACGSDDADRADDPAGDPTTTATPPDMTGPDPSPSGPGGGSAGPGYEVVGLYSQTAAGGTATEELTPIGTPDELAAYVAQFRGGVLANQVTDAAEDAGGEVAAAVVGLGCDIPPGVEVTPSGDSFTVQPQKVTDPLQECLAPVTTVVVLSLG